MQYLVNRVIQCTGKVKHREAVEKHKAGNMGKKSNPRNRQETQNQETWNWIAV